MSTLPPRGAGGDPGTAAVIPPPPLRPLGPPRRWPIVVGALATVALVVLALGFANVVPGFHLSPSGSGSHGGSGAPTYPVTFRASGLVAGGSWSVSIGGSTYPAVGSNLSIERANGSYSYTVTPPGGDLATPAGGSFQVAGAPVSFAIAFSPSAPPGQESYDRALALVSVVAAAHDAAAVLDGATAYVSTTALSNSTAGIGNATCRWSGASTIEVAATTAPSTSGLSGSWTFLYADPTASTVLLYQVNAGTASYLGEIAGPGCLSAAFAEFEPLPSNVIDSTEAASIVAANASSFTSAHPNASAEYALLAGYHFAYGNFSATMPPTWDVTFTTCSLAGGTGPGSEFVETLNATDGAVIYDGGVQQTICGPSLGLPGPTGAAPLPIEGAIAPAAGVGAAASPAVAVSQRF